MRKGIVIKFNDNRATLMAEDCTFCEIEAFKGMYKGMEVCFSDMDIVRRKVAYRTNKYINAACFILLVFCSYLFLSFYQENIAAYAYVGIDINPSIEIALNKKGQIIKARGLDEEGKELLEGINIRKMDSVEGVKQIIAKTIDMDYLEPGDSNEITVYAVMEKENNKDGSALIQKVERAIKEEVVAHSIKGEIKTIVSDKKIKNKADKMGISVAQYISEDAKTALTEDKKGKNLKEEKDKDNKIEVQGKKYKEEKDNKTDKGDKDSNDSKDSKKNKTDETKDSQKKYEDKKDMNKNSDKENKKVNNKPEQEYNSNKQKNEKNKNKSNEKPKNKN